MSGKQQERRALDVDPDVEKRLAELIDGDAWALADCLVDVFPPSEYPNAGNAHNGLHERLREYELALKRDYGIELKPSTMRDYRATAMVWPHASRDARAPFGVHKRMRGEDRLREMAKRIRQAEMEGDRALSVRQLQRFRSDEKPMNTTSMREVLRRRLASSTKRVLLEGVTTDRDDWWNVKAVSAVQRAMAVEELRRLADLLDGGTP